MNIITHFPNETKTINAKKLPGIEEFFKYKGKDYKIVELSQDKREIWVENDCGNFYFNRNAKMWNRLTLRPIRW